MFCRDCGKELGSDVQFCDGCGARQRAPHVPQAAPATRTRVNVTVVAVIAVAVVLIAGFGWAVFLRPTNASDYENRVSDAVEGVLEVPTDIALALNDVGGSGSDEMGEQDLATLRATLDKSIETVADARDTIDALRPPGEYEGAHADLLAALDELNGVAEDYSRMLDAIEPEDTQSEVSSEFSDRFYSAAEDAFRAYGDLSGALEDLNLNGFDVEQLIDGDLY